MSTLSHATPAANLIRFVALPETAPARVPCTGQATRWGHQVCRKASATDLTTWCDPCFDEFIHNLEVGAEDWSDFLGSEESLTAIELALPDLIRWRTTDPEPAQAVAVVSVEKCESPFDVNPPFAPVAEPDDLASWLDAQAAMYRVGGNDASGFVARHLEEMAGFARVLDARTVDEYEARDAIMRDLEADQAAELADVFDF